MKKLLSFFAAALLTAGVAFSQPVSDMQVIPIGVTLNSILRLNVISGGNIEFVVSSIGQYTAGINLGGTIPLYDTRFTVSSSVDFTVNMYSESASLMGTDNPANTMPLDNIGYSVDLTATGPLAATTNYTTAFGTVLALASAITPLIDGKPGFSAGDAQKNEFTIHWRLGTKEGGMRSGPLSSLLEQSLASDRYSTNVILNLVAQP